MKTITRFALGCLAASIAASGAAMAQGVSNYVVRIDRDTTQPVLTGLVPATDAAQIVFFAEGTIQTDVIAARFDEGWFGPAGQAQWTASDQPITDLMPYGALVGGFGGTLGTYQFMGRMGTRDIQLADVGRELSVALNMSDADLASMNGSVIINVVFIPEGAEEYARVVINRNTALPVGTGLVAEAETAFLVLPYGQIRDGSIVNSTYSGGYCSPAGLAGITTAGQPRATAPHGALLGRVGPSNSFYVGDGGSWVTSTGDFGHEVELLLNLSAAEQATMTGKFVVNVVKIPLPTLVGVGPVADPAVVGLAAYPNPARSNVAVQFSLESETRVHLRVYDARGRVVRTLLKEDLAAGTHQATWDGRDEAGRGVPAGSYFYQLATSRGSSTGRIVLQP